MAEDAPLNVVIAGGGVAALEAMLALRDHSNGHVALTLVSPRDSFVYRPLSVGSPFALGDARTVPLADIARDCGAELRIDALTGVDTEAHTARLESGDELHYDALLVAVGARRVPAFDRVLTFRGQEDADAMHGLIQDVESRYARRIVFLVPAGVAWPLPIYELALMTAQRAYEMSLDDVELTIVTPEESPLAVFGPTASADVAQMLEAAGIGVETSSRADVTGTDTVTLHPGGKTIEADRIVALPHVAPIEIEGLPADSDGFLPTDEHGHVLGVPDVYAAGDGTSFPVKQGGLACQEADAAAEGLAERAGTLSDPKPFRPVLRGRLMTGARPLYMRTDVSGTSGDVSASSGHTLWWPPSKIAGDYLAPYLATEEELDSAARIEPGAHRVALITEPLEGGHGIELLGFDRLKEPRRDG
jgi:sulfide:quinone oxidoreductase